MSTSPCLAVILAGGQSRRMGGGDKALLDLNGQPLISHVIARLAPQVDALAINANGDPARFAPFGIPVFADGIAGQPGPLAGVLAALLWAQSKGASSVITVTSDLPFLPLDLVRQLGPGPSFAQSQGRDHATVGHWPISAAPDLHAYLNRGERRVMAWAKALGAKAIAFDGTPDPFFNVNTPEDLAWAKDHADAV